MTIEDRQRAYCAACQEGAERARKLHAFFDSDVITFSEYAYNVAFALVVLCDECQRTLLTLLPDSTALRFAQYLHYLYESEGLPLVMPFVADHGNEEEIRRRKTEIEPKVERLRQAIRNRISSIQ